MSYLMTIGCEIHTEMKTKSKMFSSSPIIDNAKPNTCINEVDLALPGIMPQPNKRGVELGIILAKALNMKIDSNLKFDRKNYFYQDLPKGFQITQQYAPIAKNGEIHLDNEKVIHIERFHLEEDTAKQNNVNGETLLDYNRAGVGLIEIVSEPDIHSKEDCIAYLTCLKRYLTFLEISDGKMENGSLRVDLNISIAPVGMNKLGTKVEIKNINSFSNVAKAIDYEFKRQSEIIESGEQVEQQTRRWDDTTGTTILMRSKSNAISYRYFVEPNIINIDISNLVNQTQLDESKIPTNIAKKLHEDGVNNDIINQLLDDYDLYKAFKYALDKTGDVQMCITWIIIELSKIVHDNNLKIENLDNVVIEYVVDMIGMIKSNKINGKQAKTIIEKIYSEKKSPSELIKILGFEQITDENLIKSLFEKYIAANPDMVSVFKERPQRAEGFFMGNLMKETKGQANPVISAKILHDLLCK